MSTCFFNTVYSFQDSIIPQTKIHKQITLEKESASMMQSAGLFSLACDYMKSKTINGETRSGIAPNIQVTYFVPWGLNENYQKKFDGGGYMRFIVGYGKTHLRGVDQSGKNWIPFDYSIGATGSYAIAPNHELGFDYSIIGIYGYSSFAYFGSQITMKYRFWRIQTEFTHGGTGIFSGAFVPKFNSGATKSFGCYFLLNDNLYVGGRYTIIPDGGNAIQRNTQEFRLGGGLYVTRKSWN